MFSSVKNNLLSSLPIYSFIIFNIMKEIINFYCHYLCEFNRINIDNININRIDQHETLLKTIEKILKTKKVKNN